MSDTTYDRRALALGLLCASQLVVFLDATVVNVALPTIQARLHFSQSALSWVVTAYLLTFGGFLLLAGRAGDLIGRRRVFVCGLAVFTPASLMCSLAHSQGVLIAARSVQGFGAAVVSAAGLALITTLYAEPERRARAMAVFTAVAAGGGTLGAIVGGSFIQLFSWQAIFLVNVPIGAAAFVLAPRLLAPDAPTERHARLDLTGAFLVTASLTLVLLGTVHAGTDGWLSAVTIALLVGGVAVGALFVAIERRVDSPLVPLGVFRSRSLTAANALAALLRAALFGWFFFAALYMQRVLGFSALATGLGFLPATIVIAALYRAAAALVAKHGVRLPFVAGTVLLALGLAAFSRAPAHGSYATDVFPGMLLTGSGGGLLFLPLVLTATTAAPRERAGLASGLVSTSQQLGGALGLAILASLATNRTDSLRATHSAASALTSGFHLAFAVSAAIAVLAVALGATLLPGVSRPTETTAAPDPSGISATATSDG